MHLKLQKRKKVSILHNYDIYKMIPKEHTTATDRAKNFKASSSSAKTWSRLNDPRIVRVSRAFGGKDRHSKVCTVRGLRDRRVRLSVPTAIQLYDLQERLGLNQPSKVIDWLLNVAKSDIDELPPLQIPPGSFSHNNLQRMQRTSYSHEKQPVFKISGNTNWIKDPFKNPASCRSSFVWGSSNKDASRETAFDKDENPARIDDQEDRPHEFSMENIQGTTYVNPPNNFFPRSNPPNLLYNPFLKWDPSSNLTLSYPPRNHSTTLLSSSQPEDFHSFNLLQFPSTLSVYQPGITTQIQSYFPSQISSMNSTEFFLKHQNFQSSQLSNPSVIPVRPFSFGMTANLLPSKNYSSKSVRNKESDFPLE